MATSHDRFAACADAVMAARGGFTPHDVLVAGPAAHGIGLGLLSVWMGGPADASALRALGRDGAARILHGMVWAPLGAGRLPPGPDLALFAYAVEAGTTQALSDLQHLLGVEESGAPDATTLAAAQAQDPAALAAAIAAAHAAWRRGRGLPARAAAQRAVPAARAVFATC
jgi:lysozyme family protein